jgi:hypothetical protein
MTMFENLTLDQLRERARLNQLRGIAVSPALRAEINDRTRREDPPSTPRFKTAGCGCGCNGYPDCAHGGL